MVPGMEAQAYILTSVILSIITQCNGAKYMSVWKEIVYNHLLAMLFFNV